MYRCDGCGSIVGPHLAEWKIPVYKTEKKTYKQRDYKDRNGHQHDSGGIGRELSSEMRLCPFCFTKLGQKLNVETLTAEELKTYYIKDNNRVYSRVYMDDLAEHHLIISKKIDDVIARSQTEKSVD